MERLPIEHVNATPTLPTPSLSLSSSPASTTTTTTTTTPPLPLVEVPMALDLNHVGTTSISATGWMRREERQW